MGVPFERFMGRFAAEERAEIENRGQILIAPENSLRDLRSASGRCDRGQDRSLDTADHLETPEDIAAYLKTASADVDAEPISHALNAAARSKGMTGFARTTGPGRQSLGKAPSPDGHPEIATVPNVVRALGLKLTVTARSLGLIRVRSPGRNIVSHPPRAPAPPATPVRAARYSSPPPSRRTCNTRSVCSVPRGRSRNRW